MPSKLISVGQLIDHSWEHYRARFVELMSVSLWLLVPTLVSIISLAIYPSYTTLITDRALSAVETTGVVLWVANAMVIGPVVGMWILITLLRLVDAELDGKKIDLRKLTREGWKQFWPMVGVNVLVLLTLIGALAFTLPGALLLRGLASFESLSSVAGMVLIIGIILATFLGIRWLIFFAYAPLSLALEGRRGRLALTRSHELVRGRFFATLARMALPKVVFVLVMFILQWILQSVSGSLVSSIFEFDIDLGVRINGIMETIIVAAGVVLLNPVIFTADVLLYRSLRETLK